MDNKKKEENIFVRLKNWFVNLAKNYWFLNWEAKIGILFLIPPIIEIISFNYTTYEYEDFAIPLFLGLMAIAGAYLIKGNLKKNE